jgi:RNA polymerase sigma-70 factor (ECF subfamily)
MRDRSDEELMQAYAKGEMKAFDDLYGRHRGPLYRYILRQVGDPVTANDLYQGSWEKIIKARARYRANAPFRAWLYRIAHNHVADHFRRSRPTSELHADSLATDNPGPEQALIGEQTAARLQAAVLMLPGEQREALLLRLEAGLDLDAIAEVTGVKQETAKSRLRYAVRKLKFVLGGAEVEQES